MEKVLIAPSILSADFAALGDEAEAMAAAGADWLHVDVMDGHFVPNLSLGLPVVKSLKKRAALPLDVHLMLTDPLFYAPRFIECGADLLTFHLESACDPRQVIRAIREMGCRCGLSLKPATPAEAAFPYLEELDLLLVMTVEPGFGGQKFMADICPKINALKSECSRRSLPVLIEVDGGIDRFTISAAAAAGAQVFVAGSALFGAENYGEAVSALRYAAQQAQK